MRTLFLAILLLAFCSVSLIPDPSHAGAGKRAMVQEWLNGFEDELAIAEQILLDKDPAEWTQEEIENYLFNAMFVIYDGLIIYTDEHRQHPNTSEVLRNSGPIKEWPGNPYNDWKPIKWENTEFVPGDVVIQLCPPELYSGLWNPVPMTFVISINGPTESYQPLESLEPWYGWAALMPGSVFQAGASTEPYTVSLAKLEEQKNN